MRACLLFTLFATLSLALPARADMGIGGSARSGQTNLPLRIFGPAVNGTGAASYEMSGPAMGIVDTKWVTYEPNERLLYVSDFYGKAIRVYPAFDTGDVAPLRVINPPALSQTHANAPVFAHDELGVITPSRAPMRAASSSMRERPAATPRRHARLPATASPAVSASPTIRARISFTCLRRRPWLTSAWSAASPCSPTQPAATRRRSTRLLADSPISIGRPATTSSASPMILTNAGSW